MMVPIEMNLSCVNLYNDYGVMDMTNLVLKRFGMIGKDEVMRNEIISCSYC